MNLTNLFYQEFPHIQDGQVVRGTIIERKCNVQFIKFIPYDLAACPILR